MFFLLYKWVNYSKHLKNKQIIVIPSHCKKVSTTNVQVVRFTELSASCILHRCGWSFKTFSDIQRVSHVDAVKRRRTRQHCSRTWRLLFFGSTSKLSVQFIQFHSNAWINSVLWQNIDFLVATTRTWHCIKPLTQSSVLVSFFVMSSKQTSLQSKL